jgi:hypothetical protein
METQQLLQAHQKVIAAILAMRLKAMQALQLVPSLENLQAYKDSRALIIQAIATEMAVCNTMAEHKDMFEKPIQQAKEIIINLVNDYKIIDNRVGECQTAKNNTVARIRTHIETSRARFAAISLLCMNNLKTSVRDELKEIKADLDLSLTRATDALTLFEKYQSEFGDDVEALRTFVAELTEKIAEIARFLDKCSQESKTVIN